MKRLLHSIIYFSIGVAFLAGTSAEAQVNPGEVVVVDFTQDAVFVLDPNNGNTSVLTGGILDPVGIAIDDVGRIFVTATSPSGLYEVDATNGNVTPVSLGGLLVGPRGVAISANPNEVLVADPSAQALIAINKNNGAQALVYSGAPFVSPFDVDVNKFGTVYVLDRTAGGGTIFEIQAGVPVVLQSGGYGQAYGLGVDGGDPAFPGNEPGGIWVADRTAGNLDLVDANAGTKSTPPNFIAIGSNPTGVCVQRPGPIPLVYLVDLGSGSVVQTDGANILNAWPVGTSPFDAAVYPDQPVQNFESTWGKIKSDYR